jgi:hypothetical protein
MSNAIRFLESMGASQLSAAEYAASVASLDLEGPQRTALLDRDARELGRLLGGREKLMFAVMAADEEV